MATRTLNKKQTENLEILVLAIGSTINANQFTLRTRKQLQEYFNSQQTIENPKLYFDLQKQNTFGFMLDSKTHTQQSRQTYKTLQKNLLKRSKFGTQYFI